MSDISISGLNKAVVLAALYNNAQPQGLGFLHYNPEPMTTAQAEQVLESTTYFDYLQGRVMKVSLASDEYFNGRLYDRDNGQGAAARAIDAIREAGIQEAE